MVLKASASTITPQLVTWHFLRHFTNMLKVRTFDAHLPIPGNLAPLQATAMIKGGTYSIEAAVEKGASELADSVNSKAEAAGATHVSFEELELPQYVGNGHLAKDTETGVSVRLLMAIDVALGGEVSRFDVCFRLWKLLPSEGALNGETQPNQEEAA